MSVVSITATTYAGGFDTAQFGGAHGNAASNSLTSIYYNPAGLAEDDGTRAYVEATTAYRKADFTRNPLAIDDQSSGADAIAANSGTGTLRNWVAAPFAAIATDGGVKGLAIAVGIYVPYGGQAEWGSVDKWKGNQLYPGAIDGPNRWSITTGKQQSIFYTGAVAYRTRDNRLSFGAGLNVQQSSIQLTRARNITGSDGMRNPDGTISEGRSLIDVSTFGASIGLGVQVQPLDDLRIGISYQSQPLGGLQKMNGTLTSKFGDTGITEQNVQLQQRMPDSARAAFEWSSGRHAIRGGVDWTHWSVYDNQCIIDTSMASSCQFLANGAFDPDADGTSPLLAIQRNWKDTVGAQIGGSYWIRPQIELNGNLRVDTNAVPDTTLEPALMDANKVIALLGGTWSHGKIDLGLTLGYVGYQTRDTPVRFDKPVSPSRNPDMAGHYEQSVLLGLFGVGVHM